MRMFDNAAVASPKVRKMLEEIARANKIPLQYGTGGGSTDGLRCRISGPHDAHRDTHEVHSLTH